MAQALKLAKRTRGQRQGNKWAPSDLRRKIDAAGFAIAAGVSLLDLDYLESIAGQAVRILHDPALSRQAKRIGFEQINSAPARPKSEYRTNELAAAGYHVLRAGIFPGLAEPAEIIGAFLMAASR